MFRSTSLLLVTLTLATALSAQEWDLWAEFEGRVSNDRSVVRGNVFAPIWQSEDSMLFFDFRGLTTNMDANEGNAGFGFRKLIGDDLIAGLYGFYDFRETEFGNQFHQGSLGAELLGSTWGFRINGYLPEDDVQSVAALNSAVFSGRNLFVQQGIEGAYRGFDLEAERMLWSNEVTTSSKSPAASDMLTTEWWASAGFFHFDQGNANLESITGPRVRTELRLWNMPLFGADSRLGLSGQYEYDQVRGSVGTAGLAVRIPLGRSQTAPPLSGIRRRMLASVVRDVDIVTNSGTFGSVERAKFERTGEQIRRTVRVDGDTRNPEARIERAGENSLVLVDGSAGIIRPDGTVDMNEGQVILGGRSVIGIVGCETGTRIDFRAPGKRPTFRSGENDAFNGATNGAIVGVNFGSTVDGPSGLILDDVTNFLLDDVFIRTSGIAFGTSGDGIESSNSSFEFLNSRIRAVGNLADGIDSNRSRFTIRNSTIDAGDDGIDTDEDIVRIFDSTVISEDDNIDASDSTFRISGSTFITNAFRSSHSLIDDFDGRYLIDDSTFIMNGVATGDAIGLDGTRSFVMTNSRVRINNGAVDGFQVEDVPEFTIKDSSITHNGVKEQTFDFDLSVDSTVTLSNVSIRTIDTDAITGDSVFDLDTTGSAVVNFTIEDSKIIGDVAEGVDVGLTASTLGAGSTINLELMGNKFASGATANDIELDGTTGTLNVVDFPNLGPNNNGATIGTTGTINNLLSLP